MNEYPSDRDKWLPSLSDWSCCWLALRYLTFCLSPFLLPSSQCQIEIQMSLSGSATAYMCLPNYYRRTNINRFIFLLIPLKSAKRPFLCCCMLPRMSSLNTCSDRTHLFVFISWKSVFVAHVGNNHGRRHLFQCGFWNLTEFQKSILFMCTLN